MKKVLLSLVVLAATAFSANAQLNIEAGMSSGNYLFNDKFTSRPGLTAGVLFDIPVGKSTNETFFIEPGVRFAMKNAALRNSRSTHFNTSWLEVPVYFGSNLRMGDNWVFTAKLGFYYAFNLSQKIKDGDKTYDLLSNEVNDIIRTVFPGSAGTQILKRHDAGVTGSLMFYYKGFGVGTGYSYGFLNTFMNDSYGSGRANTSCWSIYLAFRF